MQQRSSEDRVFLGLVQKLDEGTEKATYDGPSDVEKRPDLPSAIWEVLKTYSDVFPSELPKRVPTGEDGS